MTDKRPRWVQLKEHNEEAAKMGRRTAYEREVDNDDNEVLKAHGDCFACEHLGAYDSCRMLAKLARDIASNGCGTKTLRHLERLAEYRAHSSDPHATCDDFVFDAKRHGKPKADP